MIKRIEKFLFFLIVFLLSFQLGKHFWPRFSYIDGIRVDYISPTLHLFDITILLLFLVYLFRLYKTYKFKKFKKPKKDQLILILFILYLSFVSFFSKSLELHLLGLVNLLEAIFLSVYTSLNFKKRDFLNLILALSIGSIIVSIIAIVEFAKQESINGVFYFLGERSFNLSTIGIATFEFSGGKVLRPYSTFPHPNVLSFFLLFSFVIVSFGLYLKRYQKLILLSLILSSVGIILSFSRITIFLYVVFLAFSIFKSKFIYKRILFTFLILIFLAFAIHFSNRFLGTGLVKDFGDRAEIAKTTFEIIKKNPLFGMGLNNYFIYEGELQKKITPTFLQPVHNIYLLSVVQVGIAGLFFVLYFVFLTIRTLIKKTNSKSGMEKSFYSRLLFLFCGTLLIGIFDHFILTLPQGLLLTALIVGFSWTNLASRN